MKSDQDTQLRSIINTEEDQNSAQKELNGLRTGVLEMGRNAKIQTARSFARGEIIKNFCYNPGVCPLEMTEKEKDFGILVDCRITMIYQCGTAVRKTKVIIGSSRRGISSRCREVLTSLYTALVRFHLDFCVCSSSHSRSRKINSNWNTFPERQMGRSGEWTAYDTTEN